MIRNKTILVTGAAGFIGSHLTKKLIASNSKLHLFLRKSTNTWRIKDILPHVKLYTVSLQNQAELKKTVSKIRPQIIYHLAAYGNYSYEDKVSDIIKTNLIGTANLICALNEIQYEFFVNTGSSSEYGFKRKPMKESDILEPNSFYAATKAAGTFFCQVMARSHKKPIVTLRPFSVYGPFEEPRRFIPTLILNILAKKSINLTSGSTRHDFIFVNDVVDCYIKIAKKIKSLKYGEIFNVGTGKQYSNQEVVHILEKLFGRKVIIRKESYPNRNWDSDYWVSDISKTRKFLDWKPENNLTDGLKKTLKWFKQNEQFKSNYR